MMVRRVATVEIGAVCGPQPSDRGGARPHKVNRQNGGGRPRPTPVSRSRVFMQEAVANRGTFGCHCTFVPDERPFAAAGIQSGKKCCTFGNSRGAPRLSLRQCLASLMI